MISVKGTIFTRDECVLGTAVDEGNLLVDASESVQGRRRDFIFSLLQRIKQILLGVIQTHDHVAVTLCVSGPQYHYLVNLGLRLEVPATKNSWIQKYS